MGSVNDYIYDFEKVLFTTTVGAKVMTPMFLTGKFSLSQNCVLMVKSDEQADEKYVYWQLFPLFKRRLDDIPSHMQPSLRISDLNKFSIIFPSLSDQQIIATYLDDKTSLIDKIISLKHKQIELLKERRIAVINQAVTK
jgi:type I restriction enzyme S subunit